MKKIIFFLLIIFSFQVQSQTVPDSVIYKALEAVDSAFDSDMTISIERLYRNETNHFRSGNFLKTLSPGMQTGRKQIVLPFGWPSCNPLWQKCPYYAPIGVFKQKENNSYLAKAEGIQTFLIFPSLKASMLSVAYHLHRCDPSHRNPGIWFSSETAYQKKYTEYLQRINPILTNKLLKNHAITK